MPGEDEEWKSALDIAMEKAQKLGSLSNEDKRKLKEEELSEVGQALGKRYLSGLPVRDIELELEKYKENRQSVVSYFLNFLFDNISPTDSANAETILEAIEHFTKSQEAAGRIRNTINEYQTTIVKLRRESLGKLIAVKKKELANMGISGSAVEPAVEACAEWLESKQALDATYKERLKRTISPLQTL